MDSSFLGGRIMEKTGKYYSTLIRRERLRRNWSQEGLCRGICAVSYLSKIEQGRVSPSEDVLNALLNRLELPVDGEWEERVEEVYEAMFSGYLDDLRDMLADLPPNAPLDFLLIRNWLDRTGPLEPELEGCMEGRQLAIQRLLQGRYEEAIALCPNAFFYYSCGESAYTQGGNDPYILEQLQTAYDLAAREGRPIVMLLAQITMGNCYSNRVDMENMERHYLIAERLARALGEDVCLAEIRYNRAATQLEAGEYEKAYAFFSSLTDPNGLSLHKLAICCEKLGKPQEAVAALERAETAVRVEENGELLGKMCAVIRFRLEHPDYLSRPEYGEVLLDCFSGLRKKMPVGFAAFHLPWVLEWYKANRQYKLACDLLTDFPIRRGLS